MDDSQQTQQKTSVITQDQQNLPQNQTTSQQASPQDRKEHIPATPISAPSKEGGPAFSESTEESIKASSPEMEISPELQHEIGAEVNTETPTLTPADANAGIVHAKESVPVSTTPTSAIVLPMSQQQAQQTVKVHKKVKDSLFWLAMLIMRQWQVAQKSKHKA